MIGGGPGCSPGCSLPACGVERFGRGLDEAVVVDEDAAFADEEALPVGDFEVVDRLDGVGLDGHDASGPAEGAEGVAGFQVAGHDPALARLPEAVDAGGADRLVLTLILVFELDLGPWV